MVALAGKGSHPLPDPLAGGVDSVLNGRHLGLAPLHDESLLQSDLGIGEDSIDKLGREYGVGKVPHALAQLVRY